MAYLGDALSEYQEARYKLKIGNIPQAWAAIQRSKKSFSAEAPKAGLRTGSRRKMLLSAKPSLDQLYSQIRAAEVDRQRGAKKAKASLVSHAPGSSTTKISIQTGQPQANVQAQVQAQIREALAAQRAELMAQMKQKEPTTVVPQPPQAVSPRVAVAPLPKRPLVVAQPRVSPPPAGFVRANGNAYQPPTPKDVPLRLDKESKFGLLDIPYWFWGGLLIVLLSKKE